MAIAYLSLGSNKGDRIGYVQQAASLLGMDEKITIVRTSAFYESEPWNMNTKNWFVNAVVEIKTQYSPQELLVACQRVECQLGRTPIEKGQYQDRTIDIDILFYNNQIINQPNLIIPHPQLINRQFVLKPIIEIAPEFVHPVYHKSIFILHNECKDKCEVKWVKHFQYQSL